jgi:4-hydroxy-2-oxoheptanedioate aldolase
MSLPTGIFVGLPSPEVVEIVSLSGFDFLVLDSEHGPLSSAQLPNLLRAARIPAIVRVAAFRPELIQSALDCGAAGVLVPQLQTADEAAAAIAASRFYPHGRRGLNGFVRAAQYSLEPLADYLAKPVRVVLQIETASALAAVDDIAALPGLDELFIGPYDLSQALGRPGDVLHSEVLAAGQRVIHAAHAHSVAASAFANSPEAADLWRQMGIDRLYYSADTAVLAQALRQLRQQLP